MVKFDETVQMKAYKSDISGLMKQMKKYTKLDSFNDCTTEINNALGEHDKSFKELTSSLEQQSINLQLLIRQTVKQSEQKIDKKLNEKLSNIPGYEPPSVSQKLGLGKYRATDTDVNGIP